MYNLAKSYVDEMTLGSIRDEALFHLRDLIFEVADEVEAVSEISQSLKWGQQSFEAVKPKTGSPIRIDALKNSETGYAMYFICTTNLVSQFREQYEGQLNFEGNRAILLDIKEPFPTEAVKHCIAMALTYKISR